VIAASLSDSERFYNLYVEGEKHRAGFGAIAQNIYLMCHSKTDDFGRFPLDGFRIARHVVNGPTLTPEDCIAAVEIMETVRIVAILRGDHDAAFEYWQFYEYAEQAVRKRTRPRCLPGIASPEPAEKWGNWPEDLADRYREDPGTSWQRRNIPGNSGKLRDDTGNSRGRDGTGRDGTGSESSEKNTEGDADAPPRPPKKAPKRKKAAKRKTTKKAKADKPTGTAARVIQRYVDALKHYGYDRPPIDGKAQGAAKRIAALIDSNELPFDRFEGALAEYIEHGDEFVQRKGFSLALFAGQVGDCWTARQARIDRENRAQGLYQSPEEIARLCASDAERERLETEERQAREATG
jgi:hypothetical protein